MLKSKKSADNLVTPNSEQNKKISIWQKMRLNKLSIYSIALSGVFIALLSAVKFMDIVMPKINGIALWEMWWTFAAFAAIVLPFAPAAITLLLAPLVWIISGQTQSTAGAVSLIFDYFIPMLAFLLLQISKKYYVEIPMLLLVAVIKHASQTISGKLFWQTDWLPSFIFNAPFTWITCAITLPIFVISFKRLIDLRDTAILNKGNRY